MLIAAVLAASALAAPVQATQASVGGIQLRAVRFWLPNSNKTSVLAMIEVPYALTTPVGTGTDSYLAYQVIVRVTDLAGELLDADRWNRHVPAGLRTENASGMEQLRFAVVPGTYWLHVDVVDSATMRITTDSVEFKGYAASPGASDLVLANRIRAVPASDTATESGELSRGVYRFVSAPTLHIDLTQPMIGFLFEAYSKDSAKAKLALKVTRKDGGDVVPLMPAEETIPAGGGIIASQFSLEGLPPGQYMLDAAITMNDTTISRTAPFTVNEVNAALERRVALTQANSGLDEVYFNALPEDSLDAAAEELQIIPEVNSAELAPYRKDELSLSAKRRFLIEFWAKRDPNKSTPQNEARIDFYNSIGYADQHFGTQYTPGWKTDRGRIFTRYGMPTDSLTEPMAGRSKVEWLVWRIDRDKDRWFIFGDRSRTGAYFLLRTNEFRESGTPGWRELIDPEQVHDIATWLGLPKTYFDNDN